MSMHNANKLKIGLFGANCSSGRAVTLVPERWSGSWADCLALAQMADAAGIEFMLPIGRWKGYGGDTDYQGETFETVTWACGLLAQTKRLVLFGTVHAPLIAPLIAAKEFVTADHIGTGRFGLNLVCGWNEGEFEMFGATLRDHESRYDYAQEWLEVIKLAWGRGRQHPGDAQSDAADPCTRGVPATAQPSGERHGRSAPDRRPRQGSDAAGEARRRRPQRHRRVVHQLPRRVALFLRRGAAAPAAPRIAGITAPIVIPAKTGTHGSAAHAAEEWIPACAT